MQQCQMVWLELSVEASRQHLMSFQEMKGQEWGLLLITSRSDHNMVMNLSPHTIFLLESRPLITSSAQPLSMIPFFFSIHSSIHFYNLKSTLSQPQMMVVTEMDEPFVPLPEDLLVNLKESRAQIDHLLDSIPNAAASSAMMDCGMGPALQVWRSTHILF
jgi:hypothetical protein